MTADVLLSVESVFMNFGGVRALDGVDFVAGEDEVVGIIGPNGAGKTTLFNVITGVLRPNAGSVRFRGRNLVGFPPDAVCRSGIARTYQKVRPFPRLSVLDNVLVPILNRAERIGLGTARSTAADLIARLGLERYADSEARNLNLFQRKKVELARAVATGARILLLDEVMAGLTAVEADGAVGLLRELQREFGFTIICIEHVMRIIMSLSHRVVALDHGRVIAVGTPAEVAANSHVQQAYLGSVSA